MKTPITGFMLIGLETDKAIMANRDNNTFTICFLLLIKIIIFFIFLIKSINY